MQKKRKNKEVDKIHNPKSFIAYNKRGELDADILSEFVKRQKDNSPKQKKYFLNFNLILIILIIIFLIFSSISIYNYINDLKNNSNHNLSNSLYNNSKENIPPDINNTINVNNSVNDITNLNKSTNITKSSGGSGGSGGGSEATIEPSDTISPVISLVNSSVYSTIAIINWTTNENSDSQVEYGMNTSYGNLTILNTTFSYNHSVYVYNLSVNVTYHYRVLSKDSSGNAGISSDYNFTTVFFQVNIGLDQVASEGSNVSFNGSVIGGAPPYTYLWNFSDGNLSNSLQTTHIYSDNGTFIIFLNVTDSIGASLKKNITINVTNVPPTPSTNGPYDSNVNLSINFTSSASDPSSTDTSAGFTYYWNFGDGTIATGASVLHNYSSNGTFNVTLNATDKDKGTNLTHTTAVIANSLTITNFVTTNVSDTEINLMWDFLGIGETGIEIKKLVNGNYSLIARLPPRSYTYTDTSLYPNTNYNYTITAIADENYTTLSKSINTSINRGTLTIINDIIAYSLSSFAIQINWSDNITSSHDWFLERSTDNITYTLIAISSANYTDKPLLPSTTYYYRLRAAIGSGYSSYTWPVNATTFSLTNGTPAFPLNLTAIVLNATLTTLNWIGINNSNLTYIIESSSVYWAEYQADWAQIANTTTNSVNISTTPESAYYLRVKARNGSNDSAYSEKIIIRTASLGTGAPKTYEIGPGKNYTSLGTLNWSSLGPNDTVYIYPNKNASGNVVPYYEKPLISVRGTFDKRISIIGVPDNITGELPIIDGTNATTSSQWRSHYLPLQDMSLVLIGTTNINNGAYSPGFLNLENLEIRNAYNGTYTGYDGSSYNYSTPAGIYLEKGDNILIKNCKIHDTGEGIFGAGQGDQRNLENITLDSNSIYGNGRVGSSQQHNTYIEAINTLYQNNTYGPTRAGSSGGELKDRGAGTIIRYNYIEGGARLIDLVETQNYASKQLLLDSYHYAYVYGNFFNDTTGAPGIHYGDDSSLYPYYRKGILYFENNTFFCSSNRSDIYRLKVFDLTSSGETLVAKNNTILFSPSSGSLPDMDILNCDSIAHFNLDRITTGWEYCRDRNYLIEYFGTDPFTGHIGGISSIINI